MFNMESKQWDAFNMIWKRMLQVLKKGIFGIIIHPKFFKCSDAIFLCLFSCRRHLERGIGRVERRRRAGGRPPRQRRGGPPTFHPDAHHDPARPPGRRHQLRMAQRGPGGHCRMGQVLPRLILLFVIVVAEAHSGRTCDYRFRYRWLVRMIWHWPS